MRCRPFRAHDAMRWRARFSGLAPRAIRCRPYRAPDTIRWRAVRGAHAPSYAMSPVPGSWYHALASSSRGSRPELCDVARSRLLVPCAGELASSSRGSRPELCDVARSGLLIRCAVDRCPVLGAHAPSYTMSPVPGSLSAGAKMKDPVVIAAYHSCVNLWSRRDG